MMLYGLFVVEFACSFRGLVRFVFDLLCDGLWLAFVLSCCGWVFLFDMFVWPVCDIA